MNSQYDAELEQELEINGVRLVREPEGLTLVGEKDQKMRGDFTSMLPRLKKSNMQHEMLLKAAKIKGADHVLRVIDATAGMGEDSLLLAAAGYRVQLFEYDPVIGALLADSLERAAQVPELSEIVSRMELFRESSIEAMKRLDYRPDIIYLDPMFPARQKSALVKKKFQLLHHLEKPCDDEEEMLQAAIDANPRRIVIKRPVKGAYLAGRKPDFSYAGKAIRYDCIVFP